MSNMILPYIIALLTVSSMALVSTMSNSSISAEIAISLLGCLALALIFPKY